jgi:hypothetical protein
MTLDARCLGVYSVVYGKILSVSGDTASAPVVTVTLSVEATLAGVFDAAVTPRVVSRIAYGGDFGTALRKRPEPRTHVAALVVKLSDGRNVICDSFVSFMPGAQPLVAVRGFDDPIVGEIIARLRESRIFGTPRNLNTRPRGFKGDEARFWESHSLVFAEVGAITEKTTATWFVTDGPSSNVEKVDQHSATVDLNIKAVLTGPLDSALDPRGLCVLRYGDSYAAAKALPAKGSRLIAVLERGEAGGRLNIPNDFFEFMPEKSPVLVVNGFDDPKVSQIISRLNELRKPRSGDARRREQKNKT